MSQITRYIQMAWRYIFAVWFFLMFIIVNPVSAEETILVRVVTTKDIPNYQDFFDSLVETLEKSSTSNVRFSFININVTTEHLDINNNNGRSINIGVGVAATLSLLEQKNSELIIGAMIPRFTFRQITSKYPVRGNNLLPVFLDQPFDRQFALIRQLLPSAESVGVILSENSKFYKAELEKAAMNHNFAINPVITRKNGKLGKQIRELTNKSDAMIAVYDPDIMTSHNIKWLLYSAYQNRVPVFGYSQSFVDAGAIGAVYSDPVDIGIQVAKMVDLLVTTKKPGIHEYYPSGYNIKINGKIARALGINIDRVEY